MYKALNASNFSSQASYLLKKFGKYFDIFVTYSVRNFTQVKNYVKPNFVKKWILISEKS